MSKTALWFAVCVVVIIGCACSLFVHADDLPGKEVLLKAADIGPKLVRETVFFRGQTAPKQLRNSGGVHFADGSYTLATMVDSSGYSSGIREKYQGYLLTEVGLDFAGKTLEPGAYGFGFINNGKFVLMDLEGIRCRCLRNMTEKLSGRFQCKSRLRRRLAHTGSNVGRDFVEFHRSR